MTLRSRGEFPRRIDDPAPPALPTASPKPTSPPPLLAPASHCGIAEAFVISEGTVKTQVKRLLGKLGLRDRTQAVVFAYEVGFVTSYRC